MEKEIIHAKFSKSVLFVSGVIVTLAITKGWKSIFPESPIVVKEFTDTIKVVHEYKLPLVEDDSLLLELKKQISNLQLLDGYEAAIEKRLVKLQKNDANMLVPNLIITEISNEFKHKGYTYGNSAPFFELECPEINNTDYIDFKINFFNKMILTNISFIRLNIFKFKNVDDKETSQYLLNEFYTINLDNENFIRLENTLSSGKYEFQVGFTFKSDLTAKYPTFYFKRCIAIKK